MADLDSFESEHILQSLEREWPNNVVGI